ncbi:pyridoxal-phosphate dependent enzyme [Azohydromonas aeria]|uniref:pyridoxal-phosphate dependent enzyme n=1 Tax=Azohydromonas aeria TaxID=2590212 RepID=UPI0012F80FEA|nr:pyridoxal-phosphate dependent enzyme [Azohydromonas aeria]
MPIHLQTPLVESDAFSHSGQRVWLKLEALQPSGSFKLRGVGHACEVHAARGARRLLSSSGGNAGHGDVARETSSAAGGLRSRAGGHERQAGSIGCHDTEGESTAHRTCGQQKVQ